MLRTPTIALCGLVAACSIGAVGACGSIAYDRSVSSVYDALEHNDAPKALGILDHEVANARPEREALLRLERAIVRARAGQFADAAADLAAADPMLEVLDLDKDVDGQLAAQLVSEAAGSYRPPPFEKLMVNALGMATRLAAGDLVGAEVEARRYQVLSRYYDAQHTAEHEAASVGRGLVALVHELAGRTSDSPALTQDATPALAQDATPALAQDGELVVMVASGRVPRRVTARLTRSDVETRLGMPAPEADAKRQLNVLALDGGSVATLADVTIDGQASVLTPIGQPGLSARATFERQVTRLYRAALNREGLRHGAKRASNGGVLGFFVNATMEGNDTPDTRAWSLLPSAFHMARMRVAVGEHVVKIGDQTVTMRVTAGQTQVVFVALP